MLVPQAVIHRRDRRDRQALAKLVLIAALCRDRTRSAVRHRQRQRLGTQYACIRHLTRLKIIVLSNHGRSFRPRYFFPFFIDDLCNRRYGRVHISFICNFRGRFRPHAAHRILDLNARRCSLRINIAIFIGIPTDDMVS